MIFLARLPKSSRVQRGCEVFHPDKITLSRGASACRDMWFALDPLSQAPLGAFRRHRKSGKLEKIRKKSGKVEIDLPASPKSAGLRTYSIAAAEP